MQNVSYLFIAAVKYCARAIYFTRISSVHSTSHKRVPKITKKALNELYK